MKFVFFIFLIISTFSQAEDYFSQSEYESLANQEFDNFEHLTCDAESEILFGQVFICEGEKYDYKIFGGSFLNYGIFKGIAIGRFIYNEEMGEEMDKRIHYRAEDYPFTALSLGFGLGIGGYQMISYSKGHALETYGILSLNSKIFLGINGGISGLGIHRFPKGQLFN